MKGRPSMPGDVREMLGNRSRRPFRADEPKPSGELKCPRSLSPDARRVWRRIVPVLRGMGLASILDEDLLSTYCIAKARWLEAQKELERYGPVIAVKGRPARNPWAGVAAECEQTMFKVGEALGLTALARARLFVRPTAPVPRQPVNDDDVAGYFEDDGHDDGVVQ